jgi:hypothetical protein
MQRIVVLVAALAATAAAPTADAAQPTRDVLVASNNWDGTADFIDPQTFQRLLRLNIVPDRAERMAQIQGNPVALAYYLLVQQEIGEGHDQLVDDAFTSHDGRYLYVSRPSFADVVAFDLSTKKIVWRAPVDGYRADHMAISRDGMRLAVSASTASVVDIINTASGRIVAKVAAGESPHENNFSKDGKLLFQASIGRVYTPTDDPSMDATKGDRYFEVVDTSTWQVIERVHIAQKLEEAGYDDYSDSIRPMAIAPDERHFYFQLSFLRAFVEYDLAEDRVLRVLELPASERSRNLRRDEYILDSAHHVAGDEPRRHEAVRRRDDGQLHRGRPSRRPVLQDPRHRRTPLLGDDEHRRALLVRVHRRGGPHRRRRLRHRAAGGEHPGRRPRPALAHGPRADGGGRQAGEEPLLAA